MNGRHFSMVIAAGLVISAPAFADDSKPPAFTPRELAHCMIKRVRSNNAESYRDAYRACKDQLESAQPERVADTMTAARLPEDPKQ
jgi:hypothetical protein